MTETAVFIAGSIVTIIVLTGGFLYGMLSFARAGGRDAEKVAPPKMT